jgi:hypothetical protein
MTFKQSKKQLPQDEDLDEDGETMEQRLSQFK